MPLLSVCIPTYNRKPFLKETLDSIIAQADKDMEIVVNDNHSTDGTEKMLEEYAKKYKFFRFSRFPENMGADRNFLRVAELAKGDFVWFFSSDDVMEPNAVRGLLKQIRENPEMDIFSLNRRIFTQDMKRTLVSGLASIHAKDEVFPSPESFLADDSRAVYTGYLPGLAVRKARWDAYAEKAREFVGTAYVHTYIFYCIMRDGGKVKALSESYIQTRTNGDSFIATSGTEEERHFRRQSIDVLGFDRVAVSAFGANSPLRRRVNEAVLNKFIVAGVFYAKMNSRGLEYYRKALPLYFKYYSTYSSFWLRIVPISIIPGFLARPAYVLRKKLIMKIKKEDGVIPDS